MGDFAAGRQLPAARSRARGAGREAGFTMVMFVIIVAIMSIMMGVAVQAVSFQMQREKEAELIFRGEQYVEAIRLYKLKYGRNPMTLKEIWEANPRVIRKKWKDPITDSFAWGIVYVGQEGRPLQLRDRGQRGTPSPTVTPTPSPTPPPLDERESDASAGSDQVGPIAGVYSTSCDESIKIWEGRTTYCEWKFVFREQAARGGRTPVLPGGGGRLGPGGGGGPLDEGGGGEGGGGGERGDGNKPG